MSIHISDGYFDDKCVSCEKKDRCMRCDSCHKGLYCFDCLIQAYFGYFICLDCTVVKRLYGLSKEDQLKVNKLYQLDSQKYKEALIQFSSIQQTN